MYLNLDAEPIQPPEYKDHSHLLTDEEPMTQLEQQKQMSDEEFFKLPASQRAAGWSWNEYGRILNGVQYHGPQPLVEANEIENRLNQLGAQYEEAMKNPTQNHGSLGYLEQEIYKLRAKQAKIPAPEPQYPVEYFQLGEELNAQYQKIELLSKNYTHNKAYIEKLEADARRKEARKAELEADQSIGF